jgi:hypothetical protein
MAPADVDLPSPWDPFWFIDYCQACLNRSETGEDFARRVQLAEWELLFSHCYRIAQFNHGLHG